MPASVNAASIIPFPIPQETRGKNSQPLATPHAASAFHRSDGHIAPGYIIGRLCLIGSKEEEGDASSAHPAPELTELHDRASFKKQISFFLAPGVQQAAYYACLLHPSGEVINYVNHLVGQPITHDQPDKDLHSAPLTRKEAWTPEEIEALWAHFPPVETFLGELEALLSEQDKAVINDTLKEYQAIFEEISGSFQQMAMHGVLYKDFGRLEKLINSSVKFVTDVHILIKGHTQAPESHQRKFILSLIFGATSVLCLAASLILPALHIVTVIPSLISLISGCASLISLSLNYRYECGIRAESKKWNGCLEQLQQYKDQLEHFRSTKLMEPLYQGQQQLHKEQQALRKDLQQIVLTQGQQATAEKVEDLTEVIHRQTAMMEKMMAELKALREERATNAIAKQPDGAAPAPVIENKHEAAKKVA